MRRTNLFVPDKLAYAHGERPNVPCILCAVKDKDNRVENLIIYEGIHLIITLNLYPYSPGHLMVFPKRHIVDLRELNEEEVCELHQLTSMSLDVLDNVYKPQGYNIGYNIGMASGASMRHLHLHIVPRYQNEIGFLDVINGARVIVEDPIKTKDKLKVAFLGHERNIREGHSE